MSRVSFLLYLQLFLVIGRPSSAVLIPMADLEMIETICKFNDDPPLCIKILSSDPESKASELAGLGRIALNKAKSVAAETSNYIKKLNACTADQRLHEIFDTCSYWYCASKTFVDEAMKDLNSGAYAAMNENSGAAGQAGFICEETFKEAPTCPSPLTYRNRLMYCLGQIATAVASILLYPLPPNP